MDTRPFKYICEYFSLFNRIIHSVMGVLPFEDRVESSRERPACDIGIPPLTASAVFMSKQRE